MGPAPGHVVDCSGCSDEILLGYEVSVTPPMSRRDGIWYSTIPRQVDRDKTYVQGGLSVGHTTILLDLSCIHCVFSVAQLYRQFSNGSDIVDVDR